MQFRGVLLAQPPVGPLRWRPPMPPLKYTEPVRNATVFGHTCTQPGSVYDNVTHGLWPSIGGVGEAQEDCLTLNIVAPIEAPLPPWRLFRWCSIFRRANSTMVQQMTLRIIFRASLRSTNRTSSM